MTPGLRKRLLREAGGHGELESAPRAHAAEEPEVGQLHEVGARRGVGHPVRLLVRLDLEHGVGVVQRHLQHVALPMVEAEVLADRAREQLVVLDDAPQLGLHLVEPLPDEPRHHAHVDGVVHLAVDERLGVADGGHHRRRPQHAAGPVAAGLGDGYVAEHGQARLLEQELHGERRHRAVPGGEGQRAHEQVADAEGQQQRVLGVRVVHEVDESRGQGERGRGVEALGLPQPRLLQRGAGGLLADSFRHGLVDAQEQVGRARPVREGVQLPDAAMAVEQQPLLLRLGRALVEQHLARLLIADVQPVLADGGDGLVDVRLHEEVGGVARRGGRVEPRPFCTAAVDVVQVG